MIRVCYTRGCSTFTGYSIFQLTRACIIRVSQAHPCEWCFRRSQFRIASQIFIGNSITYVAYRLIIAILTSGLRRCVTTIPVHHGLRYGVSLMFARACN